MTALFSTTPKSSTRQITMKAQNMIVLTVEFTRTPFWAGEEVPELPERLLLLDTAPGKKESGR
jgi:hypothetical protein